MDGWGKVKSHNREILTADSQIKILFIKKICENLWNLCQIKICIQINLHKILFT